MISAEQLSAALECLDPRDAEVLSLSLGRRVPDESLARMFGVDPAEIARRRTVAITRLADQLGLQDGPELGRVLESLSEPLANWPGAATRPRRARRLQALAACLAALAFAGGAVLVASNLSSENPSRPAPFEPILGDEGATSRPTERERRPFTDGRETERRPAVPAARRQPDATCHTVALVDRRVLLRSSPRGPARLRLARRTEWDSPRVLGVVRRRGAWLAVQAPELENGEVGWLHSAAVAELGCVDWSLHADLSRRLLTVRHEGRVVRRLHVAVGNPSNPTPRGRFTVTDKLRVTDQGSPYGCCVLALTGHQLRLPAGWAGGDRLAVHATNDLSSIGQPASLGCLRTDSTRARWLIETIPLGAPIFIRS
jgi:hypothetical protein